MLLKIKLSFQKLFNKSFQVLKKVIQWNVDITNPGYNELPLTTNYMSSGSFISSYKILLQVQQTSDLPDLYWDGWFKVEM